MRWDIFCKVIDNFGDIGVTWRLARQLQHEHNYQVRLWVDELDALQAICPSASKQLAQQVVEGVEIYHWHPANLNNASIAEVVVEAFACEIPESYLQSMRSNAQKPLWLNLEYLTAEAWAGDCHALPSMQGGGLSKFFFFPGFTKDVGGLLREQDLIARRDAFIANKAEQHVFLKKLGVIPKENTRLISLFAYENQAVGAWLEALTQQAQASHVLVPKGKVLASVEAWLGRPLALNQPVQCATLTLQLIDFIEQREFDKLLWCCDFNCVRGEDSLVRAIWAGKPFVWHIYPQQENAHLDKLNAFLDLYLAQVPASQASNIRHFFIDWNQQQSPANHWRLLTQDWLNLQTVAKNFTTEQIKLPDLASTLANFHKNWL